MVGGESGTAGTGDAGVKHGSVFTSGATHGSMGGETGTSPGDGGMQSGSFVVPRVGPLDVDPSGADPLDPDPHDVGGPGVGGGATNESSTPSTYQRPAGCPIDPSPPRSS